MKTFTGKFSNGSYVLSGDDAVLKSQLVSVLNTPIGSRFYYPSYGSHLNEFRFSVINHFTINMISQEIKSAVDLLDGVSLIGIQYYVKDNKLYFDVGLSRLSNKYTINLSVSDGIAS